MTDRVSDVEREAGSLPPEARFLIQRIYVKDISYEAPNTPDVFRGEWKPDVDLQMQSSARGSGAGSYEVSVRVTVTVTVGEQTAYLVEVVQAGLFSISGVGTEELNFIVGSICPNIIFPYVRETVSDLVVRGGFPQLVLAPVNFEVLYRRHREQQGASIEAAPPPTAG
jgi:preprotein translocase subunit SecB